jgi:hypothetical protein
MTEENAKEYLINISYKLGTMGIECLTEKDGEKMREAIRTLEPREKYITEIDHLRKYISKLETQIVEQESCVDAISREAMTETFTDFYFVMDDSKGVQHELGRLYDRLNALPPVTPQQKVGKWIDKTMQSGCGVIFYNVECSECGESSELSHTSAKYCPNCGAKMQESKEP